MLSGKSLTPESTREFCVGSAGRWQNSKASGLAGFSCHRLRRAVALLAFEERHDRHRVAMPEREVRLQPGHHGARFHARAPHACLAVAAVLALAALAFALQVIALGVTPSMIRPERG